MSSWMRAIASFAVASIGPVCAEPEASISAVRSEERNLSSSLSALASPKAAVGLELAAPAGLVLPMFDEVCCLRMRPCRSAMLSSATAHVHISPLASHDRRHLNQSWPFGAEYLLADLLLVGAGSTTGQTSSTTSTTAMSASPIMLVKRSLIMPCSKARALRTFLR